MIFSGEFRALMLILAVAMPLFAFAQGQQISEGVRAIANVGGIEYGPKESPYVILAHPPIVPYMSEDARSFSTEAEFLKFFQSLPPELQKRGLWITRGLVDRESQEDKNRLARLVQEARRREILMYMCSVSEANSGPQLVAWECQRQSPSEVAGKLLCIPRDKPHQGHPWWDCKS